MSYLERLQLWFKAALARAIADARSANPFRAFSMLLSFAVLMAITNHLNPAKGPIVVWMLTKATIAVWFGYWADRVAYWYSRPHSLEGIARGAAEKRRATIIFGAMIIAAFAP